MSSLGFQTIYREIHLHPDVTAERAFLPDAGDDYRGSRTPVFTYESETPLGEFPILAFSVSYELEIPGVLEMLDLSGIPLLRSERGIQHPLVVVGGPLTNSNPMPLAPFADLIILGEAEELIHVFLDAAATLDREALLSRFARTRGCYVPGRTPALGEIAMASDDTPAGSLADRHSEHRLVINVSDRARTRVLSRVHLLRHATHHQRGHETGSARGCSFVHSRACPSCRSGGGCGHRSSEDQRNCGQPRGQRDVKSASRACGQTAWTKSSSDCLPKGGIEPSLPPPMGLRSVCGISCLEEPPKNTWFALRSWRAKFKLKRLKLYEMVGLPGETPADIDELIRFSLELAQIVPVSLGVSPFVAKRNTPLDGVPFEPIASIEAKLSRLRRGVRGKVEVRPTSARWAWVEHMLSQGGEDAGLAAMDAWRGGGSFATWKRAFKERDVKTFPGRPVADGRRNPPSLPQLS